MSRARQFAVSALALSIMSACHGDFQPGDIYLISASLPHPMPPPTATSGVMHVNPLTGALQLLAQTDTQVDRAMSYDPFRDRLVVKLGGAGTVLKLVDSVGTITDLPTTYANAIDDVAPTGDGRIYMLDGQALVYLDAAGDTHTLFESDGVTPFNPNLSGGGVMIYDAVNNALLIGDISSPGIRLRSVPLSEDGSQVSGAILESIIDPVAGLGETPVGFSEGPGGQAFLKLDDNSNSLQPRMLLVDLDTLAVQTYAQSNYFGVAGEVAGCYSSVRDQAIVLDSLNDLLRVFSFGESGEGTSFAIGASSSGGSGEVARLLEIGGTILGDLPLIGDINNDGEVDELDRAALCATLGTSLGDPGYDPDADLNEDGVIDHLDLAIFGALLPPCDGDLVTSATFQPPPDGQVDAADLAFLLGAWGDQPSCADFVTSRTFAPPPDGKVDAADLAFLLGGWGACE